MAARLSMWRINQSAGENEEESENNRELYGQLKAVAASSS